MKKIIIISGMLILMTAAFGQRRTREAVREPNRQTERVRTNRETTTRQKKSKEQTHQRSSAIRQHNNQVKASSSRERTSRPQARKPIHVERREASRRQEKPVYRKQAPSRNASPGRNYRREQRSANPADRRNQPGNTQAQRPRYQSGTVVKQEKYRNQGQHPSARKQYSTPGRIHVRKKPHHYKPAPVRRINYHHYRVPKHVHVVWTRSMWREYRVLYPEFRYWYYPTGYTILNIPAYHAWGHIGEVRNVYGRVHEVYYSWSTDEYYLYFGGSYPYHDFTVIMEGRNARRFARNPEYFFEGRYLWVTGLVSIFDGKPEVLVKRRHQVHLY